MLPRILAAIFERVEAILRPMMVENGDCGTVMVGVLLGDDWGGVIGGGVRACSSVG